MKLQILGLLIVSGLFIGGCSNSPSSSIASGIGLIESGVQKTGSSLAGSRELDSYRTTPFTSDLCGAHGKPQKPTLGEGGGDMDEQGGDGRYPFVFTYCALSGTDGDTVGGGFALAKSLICSLEKGGIQFAGAQQTILIDGTDTTCWPNGAPTRPSFSINATGSSPAAFNNHFEKGVVFSVPMGAETLTFKIGANVSGDKVEFIGHESWTNTATGLPIGQTGVMAGEITKSTGVLKFEKRDERISNLVDSRDLGWNRHTRLIANLTMSGDTPTGLLSFDYGYADTQDSAHSATVVTARGDLATRIKARLFKASQSATADLAVIGNWSSSELTNNFCANQTGMDGTGNNISCGSQGNPGYEGGIGLFTADTTFLLYDQGLPNHTHKTPLEWLTAFGGFTSSTSVNLDEDVAYTPNP